MATMSHNLVVDDVIYLPERFENCDLNIIKILYISRMEKYNGCEK